jgi:drug/metabolite transporter (DMT)-like permease
MAALGLMAVSATLFALMNLLARLAAESASWATTAAVRALIGALVSYVVARARGRSLAPSDRKALLGRSLFGTISMVLTFYALSSPSLPLGDTVTLLNLSPVFLAVLAPIFLREKTTAIVGVAMALALTGVVFVVRPAFLFGGGAPRAFAGGPTATTTAMVAVAAAFSTSFGMMMLRRVGQKEAPEAVAFHFSMFAGITMTLLSLFDLRVPTLRSAAYMVGAGVCAGIAQLAMTRAYALEHAARVGGMGYLSVVASTLLGAAVLGERPTSTTVLGATLVIVGGVLVTLRGARMR